MTAVITLEKLTKSYGSHRGIVGVDLTVEKGEIFGFLGPNGAGKTTTIRTLLDLIRPTSGRALVFGIESSADPVAIHRRIGYIPGEFALYDRLTGGQTLDRVEKHRPVDLLGRRESEGGVALELGQPEVGPERRDDGTGEIRQDVLGVVQLDVGKVARVPGNIGDQEAGGLRA